MKADLHVHSYRSGHARYFRWLHARDCYSDPEAIYRVAKARGMDLVCLTDHDCFDGCREFLDRHPDAPDFIAGEEIECLVPDAPGLRVHLGALGMTEQLHRDVQPLRSNVFEAAAFLRESQVFCIVNHLFMFFRDQMPLEQYVRRALSIAPGIETQNGAMIASHNGLIADIAAAYRRAGHHLTAVGGSDAHTLDWVGSAYTIAPGRTREEFLACLREGRTETGGLHGGNWRLMSEVYGVILKHWRTLLGLERHGLDWPTRLVSGVCSALLLPGQFVPALLVLNMKRDESRRLERYRRDWKNAGDLPVGSLVATERSPI